MRNKIIHALVTTIQPSRSFYFPAFFTRNSSHFNESIRGSAHTSNSTVSLSSSISSSNRPRYNMSSLSLNSTDISAYNYEDKDAFSSFGHIGYSMESHPQDFSGGWLAHRAGIEEKGNCWVKDAGSKITVSF